MGSSTRLFHQALALRAADPLAKTVKNIMPVEVTSVEPHDYDKLAKEGYTEKEIIDLKKQYGWGRERGPDDISDNVKKILRLLRTLDIVETTELMDEMSVSAQFSVRCPLYLCLCRSRLGFLCSLSCPFVAFAV